MKKALKTVVILIVVIAIGFVAIKLITTPKSAEIGETVKYANNGEFVVNDITVYNDALEMFADGYRFSEVKDDEGLIMVDFTMKNTGKIDFDVEPKVIVNYDNGVEFTSEYLFHKTSTGSFELCQNGFLLEKVTSDAETFVVVVPVPQQVIENEDKSLEVEVYYKNYIIR
ncbi:MAG: hypothetical protein J6B52_03325 [Clostridia bacterium]|nr:hypothetical protein [Clostridia bacterium]